MVAGAFREDLCYRLAVVRIALPPLRERVEDIRWLTERMLRQMALEQGKPLAMSEAFLRDVMARNWKGNARKLRSFLEESVVFSEAGILDAGLLASPISAPCAFALPDPAAPFVPLQLIVEEAERLHIQRGLEQTAGSVSKTAELLGISRKTLWEKMKRLQIGNVSVP